MSSAGSNPLIVTIADRNYVLPVYILAVSLRYYGTTAPIHVIGVDLLDDQIRLLEQFDGVRVIPADPSNKLNAATRKGEALLTALETDCDWVNLLDGDCIATGDLTPHLTHDQPGLSARRKFDFEDVECFGPYYADGEERQGFPEKVIEIWQKDVGERDDLAIDRTVTSGNIAFHRDYLDFARKWQEQCLKVLPKVATAGAYDHGNPGYFQLDESVLNSLRAFSHESPPLIDFTFNSDPDCYLAHLGPGNPRFWKCWPWQRWKYHAPILKMLDWASSEGYDLPKLPWTLRKLLRPVVWSVSLAYFGLQQAKGKLRG